MSNITILLPGSSLPGIFALVSMVITWGFLAVSSSTSALLLLWDTPGSGWALCTVQRWEHPASEHAAVMGCSRPSWCCRFSHDENSIGVWERWWFQCSSFGNLPYIEHCYYNFVTTCWYSSLIILQDIYLLRLFSESSFFQKGGKGPNYAPIFIFVIIESRHHSHV